MVTRKKAKTERIYLRVDSDIKSDFERIAAYRRTDVSELIRNYMVETVNQERELRPALFESVSENTKTESNDEEWSIEQPAYQGKFHKKDKEKAS